MLQAIEEMMGGEYAISIPLIRVEWRVPKGSLPQVFHGKVLKRLTQLPRP